MINRALTSHYAAPYSDHQFSHEFQIVFKVAKDNLRPTVCMPACLLEKSVASNVSVNEEAFFVARSMPLDPAPLSAGCCRAVEYVLGQ